MTLAVVQVSPAGTVGLKDLVVRSLDYDFSNESGWLPAVEAGIRSLIHQRKGLSDMDVILPGFKILTKALKIPHVETEKRRQIIAYEVQQSLPYAIDEITWDTQMVADDGIETELLFLAAKQDFVEAFCEILSRLGLRPSSISAGPLLDINAARFCLDLQADHVLVVNIGARSSKLSFVGEDRFFVRTLALGGNQLTQNVADSLGSSFVQAETLKLKFFAEEDRLNKEDPQVKMMHGHGQQFAQRLNMELTRSLLHFKRQSGGAGVREIYLTGRGAQWRGLIESVAEWQKLPVRGLPLAESLSLSSSVSPMDPAGYNFELSEILGQAAKSVHPNGVGVNLLPEGLRQQQAFSKQKPTFMAAAALLALSPLPLVSYFYGNATQYEEQVRQVRAALPTHQVLAADLNDTLRTMERYHLTLDRVDDFINSRTNWLRFFSDLQDSLTNARDVWLDTLEVSRRITLLPAPEPEEPEYDEYGEIIPPEPIEQLNYRLTLSGAMLLRQSTEEGERPVGENYDERVISERVRTLIQQFSESEFIIEAGAPTILWTRLEDGVLPFTFNLTVNPDKPL